MLRSIARALRNRWIASGAQTAADSGLDSSAARTSCELEKNIKLPAPAKTMLNDLMSSNSYQLMRDSSVRYAVTEDRLNWFLSANAKPRIFSGMTPSSIPHTVSWNLDGMKHLAGFGRGERIVRVLLSLDDVLCRVKELKVLVVGPRTEDELLEFLAWGFEPDHVRGLDLISYSPFVDIGDMHAMPYADGTFDIVIMSNVLSYSTDQSKACSELLRVATCGAIVAVSEGADRRQKDISQSHFEKLFGETSKSVILETPEDMLSLFGGSVGHVLFNHPIPPNIDIGNNVVVFRRRPPKDISAEDTGFRNSGRQT